MIITCITIGTVPETVFSSLEADYKLMVNLGANPEFYQMANNIEYLRFKLAALTKEPMFSPMNKCYVACVPGAQATALLLGVFQAFTRFNNIPDVWVQDPLRRAGDWIVASCFMAEGLDWAQTYPVDSNLPNFAEYITQNSQ
jgi:hypothetical protein